MYAFLGKDDIFSKYKTENTASLQNMEDFLKSKIESFLTICKTYV